MMKIKGCGTALVTPFKDGKVDFESYKSWCEGRWRPAFIFLCLSEPPQRPRA